MDAVGLSLCSLSGCQKKKLISSSSPTKVFRQLYTVVVSFQSNHHIVMTGRFHRSCGHTSIRATGIGETAEGQKVATITPYPFACGQN
jgi:hypothetical protein